MQFKLGVVTHYYENRHMAIVALDNTIGIGDEIYVVQMGEEVLRQSVKVIQIEHERVQSAQKGQIVGLTLEQEVEPGAEVFKTQTI